MQDELNINGTIYYKKGFVPEEAEVNVGEILTNMRLDRFLNILEQTALKQTLKCKMVSDKLTPNEVELFKLYKLLHEGE